jgi:1-acyl-sn-glycerol-3-phosphate acyltransferase
VILGEWARRAPGLSAPRVLLLWAIPGSILYGLFKLLYRLRCVDVERIPREGPIVFVANHQSHFDPVLVGIAGIDRPSAYLARASLFAFRPFAMLIRLMHAIPIDRDRGSPDAMREAIDVLRAGRCVTMFPEGTRTRSGAVGAFRPGMVLVARRGGASILPVAIEGAHDVWPSGRRGPRLRGRIMVRVGAPIGLREIEEGDQRDIVERLRREIDAMRLALRAELRASTHGGYPPPGPGDAPSLSAMASPCPPSGIAPRQR